MLVAGFWLALISTFLGWALICFAEMTGYLRLKRFKWAFYAFALGMLWQLFSLAFCHLFLEVLDEIFFAVSATSQNWALAAIGFSTLFLGALIGQHKPLPGADD